RRMTEVVEREKASATIVAGPIHLPSIADAATRALIDAALRSLGAGTHITAFDGESAAVTAALAGATGVTELMGRNLVTLDERASGVRLRRGGVDVTADLPHSLLYSVTAFETYFVYWSGATAAPLDLDIAVRDAPTPKVKDLMTGALQNPTRVERHGDRVVLGLPAADHPLVVDFNFGNAGSVGTSVDVRID